MNDIVWVKAEVISRKEKIVTVRLLNGFGNPEEQVHEANIVVVEPKR